MRREKDMQKKIRICLEVQGLGEEEYDRKYGE